MVNTERNMCLVLQGRSAAGHGTGNRPPQGFSSVGVCERAQGRALFGCEQLSGHTHKSGGAV